MNYDSQREKVVIKKESKFVIEWEFNKGGIWN